MKKFSRELKETHGKALPIILLVIAIVFVVLYLKTDLIDRAYSYISGSQNQQVTYYQWTDAGGEMVISRNKPTTTDEYISFQASEDLMKNEHNVDQDLIDKSKNIRSTSTQQDKKNEKSSGNGSISNAYPFKAMNKARNCTNLSSQIADARNRGKDTSKLKEQHAKECR